MVRMLKKVFCAVLAAAVLAVLAPAGWAAGQAAPAISVVVNGAKVAFPDQQPIIQNDRTYIPVRFVGEALGADVVWEESSQSVTITKGDILLYLEIGDSVLYKQTPLIAFVHVDMGVAPILLNGRTMLPIRFVAEELGCLVGWDEKTQTVSISPVPVPPGAGYAMTEREAWAIANAWVENNPFQFAAELSPHGFDYFFSGVEYYYFEMGIIRYGIVEILVDKESGAIYHLTSPGGSTFEFINEWYAREHAGYFTGVAQDKYLSDMLYKDISMSRILDENPEMVLGKPLSSRGPYYFYDGLEIYFTSYVDLVNCTDPRLLSIDGITLDKTRAGLTAAFGEPVIFYEYPEYEYHDADNDRTVRYHVSSYIIDYMLEFEFEGPDEEAYIVSVRRFGQ